MEITGQRETQVARWKRSAAKRNHIDITPIPSGDVEYFLNGQPGRSAAPTLYSGKALLLNRRQQLVIVKDGRGGIVVPAVDPQYSHAWASTPPDTASAGARTR